MSGPRRVLALCGGVGGTKLALGLSHIVEGDALTIVVNTGDDFDHLGLRICPDIDTVTYTLADIVNPETGWGRAEETGQFMAALSELGGEQWFFLGDKDLALHVERTQRLAAGQSLDAVTADISKRYGIGTRILPMSNDPVATQVETADGVLAFQHYFVRERCQPQVTGFHFAGSDTAQAHPELIAALQDETLEAVVICPSNPFVSVDPILALPGVRQALRETTAPVVAISPIVGGAAVKGPTAKMMEELGLRVTPDTVLNHYTDFLDGFILDQRDAANLSQLRGKVGHLTAEQTLMRTLEDKIALAVQTLAFARTCQPV